jgi:hypothetical protein
MLPAKGLRTNLGKLDIYNLALASLDYHRDQSSRILGLGISTVKLPSKSARLTEPLSDMVNPAVRLRLNACRAVLGISDTMNEMPFRDLPGF